MADKRIRNLDVQAVYDASDLLIVDNAAFTEAKQLALSVLASGISGSSLPVADTTNIVKGSVDDTKLFRFEADGITTATTRVGTIPDFDFTFAGINIAQTFSAAQTMTADLTFNGQFHPIFSPGSDTDFNIFTSDVTGSPTLSWDESEDLFSQNKDLRILASAGRLVLATSEITVVDGDILGQLDFQAPLEGSSGDSRLIAASIWAEADDTFSTTVNDTDLVFATALSETATEKMRLDSAGDLTVLGGVLKAGSGNDMFVSNNTGSLGFKLLDDGARATFEHQTDDARIVVGSNGSNKNGEMLFSEGGSTQVGAAVWYDGSANDLKISVNGGGGDIVDAGTVAMRVNRADGHITMGRDANPTTQVDIIQDDPAGGNALRIEQDDVDAPLLELEATIATGNAIEAVGAKTLTTTHFIMVEITGGLIRYLPVGTIA